MTDEQSTSTALTMISPIRGMHFRPSEAKAHYATADFDQEFQLEFEPDNRFDPNAIKVIFGSHHIAYVGKEYAEQLAGATIISCSFQGSDTVEIQYEPSE